MAGHRWLAAQVCLILMLAACGGDEPVSPRIPASIIVVPNEPLIFPKETRQLSATVVDAAGEEVEGESVEFASSDTAVVTVSPSGLLTSVGPVGEAVITVRDGELTASITARVGYRPSSITIMPDPILLNPTLHLQLGVVVTDGNGDPLPTPVISYVSSDPAIVAVSAFGTITSPGPVGSATITVSSNGLSKDVAVTVAPIPTRLSVDPTSMIIASGGDQQITAAVLDAAGHQIPGTTIAFTSNQPDIFTVSSTGLVHSQGPAGSGTIAVASGSLRVAVGVFIGDSPPGALVATVTVPAPWGVTVTPSGKYFVALTDGGIVGGAFPAYAFPFSAPTASGDFPPPVGLSLAVNAAETRAYVAQAHSEAQAPTEIGVGTIDLVGSSLLDVITVSPLTPLAVALSADESAIYVGTNGGIRVFDLASKTLLKIIDAPGSVNAFSRHPSLPMLYATVNQGSVVEIDMNSRSITRSFTIPGTVQGTVVSRDGTELYVAIEDGGLVVWDLIQDQIKSTIDGAGGFGVGLSPDGDFLYVAGQGNVRIYNRASMALLHTVETGGHPRRIGFDPLTGTAIITNSDGWVDFIK